MSDIDPKKAIEAVLFSVGKLMPTKEIARIAKCSGEETLTHLASLVEEYKTRESPFLIYREGDSWKMTVGERYLSVVKDLLPETEFSKSVLETLAVVAWKAPVLQSEVISIRTNKAYEHIKLLTEKGFLTKIKSGRSFKLTLTQKFLDYFDVRTVKKFQEKIHDFGDLNKLATLFSQKVEEG